MPCSYYVYTHTHSQGSGKLKYIEQNELYASNSDPDQDLLNPHRDFDIIPKLADTSKHCKEEEGAKPIIDSLKSAKLPDSVLEPVLHARSLAMNDFPKAIKPILTPNTADEFVAQRDQAMMKRNDSVSSIASSPLSTLSPPSASSSTNSGQSATANTRKGSTASRIGSLSSSVASPLSSVSSPPISPPTTQSNAPSPNTTASVLQNDTSVSSKSLPAMKKGQFTQVQKREWALPNLADSQRINSVQDHSQMMVAPTVVQDRNGVQSPPSVASSGISSPANSAVMMLSQQNFGNGHLGSHVANGAPSPSSSTVSAVSSPPSVFSPEMGTKLHTAFTTDSIPPVPFQNIQTSNFILQAQAPVTNGLNHEIPSDFNFTSPYLSSAVQNPAFIPNPTTTTTFGTPNSDLNPNDPVVQQLMGDLVTLNGDPNFSNLSSLPNVSTANSFYDLSHSEHPHTDFRTVLPNSSTSQPPFGQVNNSFAMSYDVAMTQLPGNALPSRVLLDSQKNYATNSNAEVQDILQQFQ